ncbi:hypothetical protein ES703_49849 [subsurface metagenome]
MLKIGRYGIAFGRTFWVQTLGPAKVWHFLWFWFIKVASLHDVDRKQKYPVGTLLEHEGRRFKYFKASDDIKKGEVVKPKREETCGST